MPTELPRVTITLAPADGQVAQRSALTAGHKAILAALEIVTCSSGGLRTTDGTGCCGCSRAISTSTSRLDLNAA